MSDAVPVPPPEEPTPRPEGPALSNDPHARWRFLRDVAVFQFKLFLDNLRDFALVPITLIAAAIDLVFKGEREGALFYKVLEWGWHSEQIIDLYSMIDRDDTLNHDFTVDAVLARLEAVVVREYEKGGTAATVKAAVDRTIDQIQREGGSHRARARDVVARAAERVKSRMETERYGPPAPPNGSESPPEH